ncbi:peptidylprolyl isomerase [Bifidobacterium leontopitheci]|uniref:Lipoprotein n=1 Tax=Bifidobacterium leontopitheci TaxID=2650774 RepID=A0A6I1GG74_9BIFI|nr:hypothetical protein [Bifidobacterium leontopitheci]KAB7790620.1 hypothetical protein F7D09_0873 [Bifidobacterium leontopitheci]
MSVMKKAVAALSGLLMVVGLASCGNASNTSGASGSGQKTSQSGKSSTKSETSKKQESKVVSTDINDDCYTMDQLKQGADFDGIKLATTITARCYIAKSGTMHAADANGNKVEGEEDLAVTVKWTGEKKDAVIKSHREDSTTTVQYVAEKVELTLHGFDEYLLADGVAASVLALHPWYQNSGYGDFLYSNAHYVADWDAFEQALENGKAIGGDDGYGNMTGLANVKFENDKTVSVWVVSTVALGSSNSSEKADPMPDPAMDAMICYSNACVVSAGEPLKTSE